MRISRVFVVTLEGGRQLVVVAPTGQHAVAGVLRELGLQPEDHVPITGVAVAPYDSVMVLEARDPERHAVRAAAIASDDAARRADARATLAEQQLHVLQTELASARRLLLEAREIAPLVQIRLGTPGESFLTALAEYKS